MAPALKLALAPEAKGDRIRQVVFLTDGAVGNERELFRLVKERLGETRLFTVGIGSAPNGYFMTRAARFGHGTHTYIGDVTEVGERMAALFAKLETPVMHEIEVDWPAEAGAVEAWPRRLPDLYRAEPVVIAARVERTSGEVVVRGRRGAESWRATLRLTGGRTDPGLGVRWAREKIAALMDSVDGSRPSEQVRAAVVEVALAHHIVSRFTSLVAVDTIPSRDPLEDLVRAAIPTNLPAGWEYGKVFGALPQTATAAPLHLRLGLAALLLAGAGLFWTLRRG